MKKRIAEYFKKNQKEIMMALLSINPSLTSWQMIFALHDYDDYSELK